MPNEESIHFQSRGSAGLFLAMPNGLWDLIS